jgi:hypothetical protein
LWSFHNSEVGCLAHGTAGGRVGAVPENGDSVHTACFVVVGKCSEFVGS